MVAEQAVQNGLHYNDASPPATGIEGKQAHDFLTEAAGLLCDYIASQSDKEQPVVRLATPDALKEHFRHAGIPLNIPEGQQPSSLPTLLNAVQTALMYSVRTGHPLFFNQLYARADPVSIVGDWLAVAANTNVHTYEVAPVFTAVEVEVLAKLASCVGGEFARQHDGLFCPGGSISNMYGMHLARNKADPQYRTRGAAGGRQMVAFTSEQAHYSYLKAAFTTGLGTDNLISVACDELGAMLPAALEAAIVKAKEEGKLPFFVGTTAGTTVLGAYDPFAQVSEVCQRHGLWHHVDGCWGAAALLSPAHRQIMQGAEQADSLAWNPHKAMGLPLQCSAFLTRHPGFMKQCNASNASYLFQPDKLNAEYDLGDKTIQCGRRADAFKLWLAWKAYGDAGYGARVAHGITLAEHFEARIRASNGVFVMAHPRSFTNVCFWYVPPSMRPWNPSGYTEEQGAALHKVAPAVKDIMQQKGDAMIGFQPLKSLPNFFRIVFPSAWGITCQDLNELLNRMDQYGTQLFK